MIYQFYGTNVEMPHELQHKKVDDKFVMEEQFTQQLLEEFTMMGKKYANAKHNSQKARTSAATERWADDAANIRHQAWLKCFTMETFKFQALIFSFLFCCCRFCFCIIFESRKPWGRRSLSRHQRNVV